MIKRIICLFKGHRWKVTHTYNMTADFQCTRCLKRSHGWANDPFPSKLTYTGFNNRA